MNTTMQCIPWQRIPMVAHVTPLEISLVLETRINGGKLKELPPGCRVYDYCIANSKRRWRCVVSEASLGREGSVKSSGTSARERRLLKSREEKRRREHERKNVYPEWAKVLEEACKDDKELREIIGDSIGDAELMRKRSIEGEVCDITSHITTYCSRIEEERIRVCDKMDVFSFNPTDSYIWIELYDDPSDKDVDFIGRTIRSWYVLGRLGGFNATNMQLTQFSINEEMQYDSERAMNALSSTFHDISNVEFQDNWARFWVDMGTSDALALDILINALICLSSSYIGIKQLVFGGKGLGDWEEGMTSVEDGYRVYQI